MTAEPVPFSGAFELLYDEYRYQARGAGWEAWLKGRTPVECGDCGDRLARPGPTGQFVHLDDGTPACLSRSMAKERKARQICMCKISPIPLGTHLAGCPWR